ncbi:MAG TPA: UDP-2,3-diacylglucosamine diphosphatase LpxI [Rhizomicrobium sp.]
MESLGILAGGGDLPLAVAQSVARSGRPVFILGLRGSAEDGIHDFPHDWVVLGETRKALELLRQHGCKDVILCGRVTRPRFSDLRLDTKSALVLPNILMAARKGDDALLRAVVDIFEREGFRIVGIAEAAPGLLVREGVYSDIAPSAADLEDVATGVKVVRRLGALDVGQAVAVCGGLVLAVEAAEGTDAMLERIPALADNIRGTPAAPRGVLVKALKPVQDRKTDLPVIGVDTVRNVSVAGLRGIAIEAGNALMIDEAAMKEAANAAGVFVMGFSPTAYDS